MKSSFGAGSFGLGQDFLGAKKKSKFGNNKVKVNGVTFDSEGEYTHYCTLKLKERTGEIRNLRHHVNFELIPAQVICGKKVQGTSYEADFVYEQAPDWTQVIEDYKGYKTPEYILKRKLMKFLLKLDVVEITKC